MTPSERAELKEAVDMALAATGREIAELEARLQPVAPDCSLGRLTRMEMIGEQAVDAKALEAAKRRFNRLTFALTRIDSDDYGICEACEEPIALARLRLVPESTLCVACANEKGR